MRSAATFLLLAAFLVTVSCRDHKPRPVTNTWSARRASPDRVVLSVVANAQSRIWLDYQGEDTGVCCIPGRNVNTTATYQRAGKGFTAVGAGLTRMHNGKATNVVFHESPIEGNGELEIGTYSQRGVDDIKIIFKFE